MSEIQSKEMLSPEDKTSLDMSKLNREISLTKAQLALTQGELSEARHTILVLQLAIKYGLAIGDGINDDGTINRKKEEVK